MNATTPIARWRAARELPAKSPRGWVVEFAVTADGTLPALDYMEEIDASSDRDRPVLPTDVSRLLGLLEVTQFNGPDRLVSRTQIEMFVGDDKKDGMCELRIGSKNGHRLICFKRPEKRFIVACGFPKPSQSETPPKEKARAREILHEHEGRAVRQARAFRTQSA